MNFFYLTVITIILLFSYNNCGYDFSDKQKKSEEIQSQTNSDEASIQTQNENKIINGPTIKSLTDSEVTISWELDEPATGQVEFGESKDFGSLSIKETSYNYSAHNQIIKNLTPNTEYFFRIQSSTQSGFKIVSSINTFKTKTKVTLPSAQGTKKWIFDHFKDVKTTTGDFNTRQNLQSPHLVYDATGTNSKYAFDFRDDNKPTMNEIALVDVSITNSISNDAHGGSFIVNGSIDTFMYNVDLNPQWPNWVDYATTNYDGITFGSTGAVYGENVKIRNWNADTALDLKSQKSTQFVGLNAIGKGQYVIRDWGETTHYLVNSTLENNGNIGDAILIEIHNCDTTTIKVYNSTFNGKAQIDRNKIVCLEQYPNGNPKFEYLNVDPRTTGEMHPMFSY